MQSNSFNIQFAGITLHFDLPGKIEVPTEFLPYINMEVPTDIDVCYEIKLLEKPLILKEPLLTSYNGIKIYPSNEGYLRNVTPLTAKDGCQVACLQKPDGKNILYYPASKWDFYSKEFHCLHLLGIETILMQHEAFLLHSSVVEMNGKTILFSGPSGIGKSTQADNWKKYLNAKVINGDRCIIRKMDDIFYGCGSPWAGTSGIYSKNMAPIAGIFLLKQGNENRIRPLRAKAFGRLYQQSIVNAWDSTFVEKLSALIGELLMNVPVYELECRPDEDAVMLAYQTLSEGGVL